jgi:hypothetical protein
MFDDDRELKYSLPAKRDAMVYHAGISTILCSLYTDNRVKKHPMRTAIKNRFRGFPLPG